MNSFAAQGRAGRQAHLDCVDVAGGLDEVPRVESAPDGEERPDFVGRHVLSALPFAPGRARPKILGAEVGPGESDTNPVPLPDHRCGKSCAQFTGGGRERFPSVERGLFEHE